MIFWALLGVISECRAGRELWALPSMASKQQQNQFPNNRNRAELEKAIIRKGNLWEESPLLAEAHMVDHGVVGGWDENLISWWTMNLGALQVSGLMGSWWASCCCSFWAEKIMLGWKQWARCLSCIQPACFNSWHHTWFPKPCQGDPWVQCQE